MEYTSRNNFNFIFQINALKNNNDYEARSHKTIETINKKFLKGLQRAIKEEQNAKKTLHDELKMLNETIEEKIATATVAEAVKKALAVHEPNPVHADIHNSDLFDDENENTQELATDETEPETVFVMDNKICCHKYCLFNKFNFK